MKTNLPKRLLRSLPYATVVLAVYFALPFAAIGAQRGDTYNLVPILDCLGCCAVGYFYGRKNGRDPLFPLLCALLFLAPMFIFYNASAWIYLILTATGAYLGQCIGVLYQNKFGR